VTPDELLRLISAGGLLPFLLLVLYGGWRSSPFWVFGREHRKLEHRLEKTERDLEHWREVAMKAMTTTERAVTTIEADHSK
jgi:hypothetical protein